MGDASPATFGKYLILAIVLLAVTVGAYFGIKQVLQHPTQPSMDVGRAVAESFLEKVRIGKAGEAWDTATAEFKSIEGRESFMRKAKSLPILKTELQFNSSQQVTIHDEPRTEFLFQSPDAKIVRILVAFERGDWKVDHLTL